MSYIQVEIDTDNILSEMSIKDIIEYHGECEILDNIPDSVIEDYLKDAGYEFKKD